MEQLKKYFAEKKEKFLEDFFTFLRFPSISADPAYREALCACALWLENQIKGLKLQVERWENAKEAGSPPVLFAQTAHDPKKKTLLIYNHYDVQPVDPLAEWRTEAFEPTLIDNKVIARGASDNKGQCFYTFLALQNLLERKALPVNIKWLIEGEEESGSRSLFSLLEQKKEQLLADHILIVDAGIEKKNRPAISLGARGIVTMTMTLIGSNRDLHSGSFGGIVYNPLRALVRMLASAHDNNLKVMVPGFYDAVIALSAEEKKLYNFHFDEENYRKNFAIVPTGMEKGFTPLEACMVQPTLEFNGISGGYSGQGFKTVIPAKAEVKISARLVPDQDPLTIAANIKKFFENITPPGIKCNITIHEGRARGFRTRADSQLAHAFSESYESVFGHSCDKILVGGSIPISADLQKVAGGDLLLVGVSLPEDLIHAPNEQFGLDQMELGFLTMVRGIELLNC